MAIRKDIDDMLNSLKNGGESAHKPAQKAKSEPTAAHKKSIYDEMSVDDLLSALTESKEPETAEELVSEAAAVVEEAAEKEQSARPVETAESPAPPAAEEPQEEDIPVIVSSVMHTEASAEDTKVFSAAEIAEMEGKAEIAETPAAEPVAEPEKPAAKKKKIVITGELPDYEEIRRRELEKDRLAREKAEAEAEAVAKESEELTAAETIVDEAVAAAEEDFTIEELTDEAPVETAPVEETEEADKAEEAPKKGLFSKIKNILSDSKTDDDTAEETETEAESAPEEEASAEEILSDESARELAESFEEISESSSATELLDAAIAAINGEAQAADTADSEGVTVFSEEIIVTEPQEESISTDDNSTEENGDAVDNMLDNIREEAEAAIADIEKTSDETTETAEVETEDSAEDSTDTAAETETPKKKGRVTSALESILDEDPDEIINERSEKAEDDGSVPQKGKFKKTLYTILGIVFAIFAVIGIITVIAKGAGLMKSFTSGEVKKDGFTEMIYPAVIMDIESFNSPSELTSEQVITATLWSVIMDESKVSRYESSLGDTVSIPDVDVEKYAVELFGENLPAFEHCTVGPVESRFYYSDGAYNVKLRPIIFTYSPEIKSIVKSGSEYSLTVDYIDELPSWMEKSVAKTVEFVLTEREDGTFRIDSMKILSVKTS